MTARISRARRAELQRAASGLRRQGQRAGWPVERIAATIRVELPEESRSHVGLLKALRVATAAGGAALGL